MRARIQGILGLAAAAALVAGSTLLPGVPSQATTRPPALETVAQPVEVARAVAPSASPSRASPDPVAATHASDAATERGATDQVVVAFAEPLTASEAGSPKLVAGLSTAAGSAVTFVRLLDPRHAVYRLDASLGKEAESTLASMDKVDGISGAEPDAIVRTADLPNDEYAPQLWGMQGATDGSPYGIDATGAWTTTRGAGVTVAVIDTGLVAHPDLAGQTIQGYDFVTNTSVSGDGDGRDADPSDPGCPTGGAIWHGTHVAGTIAALANNDIGVFGAAPEARVLVVRVLGGCGSGYLSDVVDAIRWSAGASVAGVPLNTDHPAQVLNMSLTSALACESYLQAAVDDARSRGTVVVAAAGNSSTDVGGFEPASCAGVVSVAATDASGKKASFSNHGSGVVVAAPGVGILSTINAGASSPAGPSYGYYDGTSMAAPHVAATAALIVAAYPGLSPDAIALVLTESARPFAADASPAGCPALGCGAGIVNASAALARLAGPGPIVGLVRTSVADVPPSGSLTVTALAVDPTGVGSAELSVDSGASAAMNAADGAFAGTSESLTRTITAPATEGSHTVCVRATDTSLNPSDGTACTTFRVNVGPPSVTTPVLTPPTAAHGSPVAVTATATDTSGVAAAGVNVDGGAWRLMSATDGAFGGTSEGLTGTVGSSVVQVVGGQWSSCGLLSDGTVQCWGANNSGQLGDGTTTNRLSPVPVGGVSSAIAIAMSREHACALISGGTVRCWGYNYAGQLGDRTTTNRLTAVVVEGLTNVIAIAAGTYHTCALIDNATVRCWGGNGSGQLGDGTGAGRLAPVAVAGLSGVTAIAASFDHTCAVLSDDTARCWGENNSGQLGDGTRTDRLAPVAVQGLSGVTAVATGWYHTCARLADGTARCWGSNSGQLGDGTTTDRVTPVAVDGLTGVTALAAGERHTCALLSDGTVDCWGRNREGQLSDGTMTWRLTPVPVDGLFGVTAIAAGMWHTCGVTASGTARCWGNNWNGQHGDGTSNGNLNTVYPPSTVSAIGALTGGTHNVCVRATDTSGTTSGGLACATLTISDATAPAVALFWPVTPAAKGTTLAYKLTFSEPVTGLATGDFSIGGTSSGWTTTGVAGSNAGPYIVTLSGGGSTSGTVILTLLASRVADATGNLGPAGPASASTVKIDRGVPSVTVPALVPSTASDGASIGVTATATDGTAVASAEVRVGIGAWASIAATDGSFGEPAEGLAGTIGAEVLDIDAGEYDTCSILGDGTARCSGGNYWGQLGDGTTEGRLTAVEVSGLSGVTAIAAQERHTCAALDDGSVRCWGDNEGGQLGDGTKTDRLVPVAVPGLSGVTDVAVGVSHSCALLGNGTARCWGYNGPGQLGFGAIPESLVPVAVDGLTGATAISSGWQHTCALLGDGTVRCWGMNWYGQIGDGSTTSRLTPVTVAGLTGVTAIAAGSQHVCALLNDKTVRCWGLNTWGQLGDGTTTDSHTPVAVAGLAGVTAIGSGTGHTCAVLTDGTARCWGWNGQGQLGDGTTTDRHSPVVVTGLTEVTSISPGGEHTCAVMADGTARCWGRNNPTAGFLGAGRLGDGTSTDRLSPVAPAGIGALGDGSHQVCLRATDSATNTSSGTACATLTVDATAATAVLTPPAAATNAATLSYALLFDEPVSGLAAGDFSISGSVTGCLIGTPTGAGATYAVDLTGCSEGTVILTLVAGAVSDAVTNPGPAFDIVAAVVTIDRTAPAAILTGPTTPTAASPLRFVVDFDEPISGLAAIDFSVTGTATGCAVGTPTGSGASFAVDLIGCSDGTVILTLGTGAVGDPAGNAGPTSDVVAATVTLDRGPVTTFACQPGSGLTNSATLACSVTFSEAPGPGSSFTADDVLVGGSATGWSAGAPVGSGSGPYSFDIVGAGTGADGTLTVAIRAGAVVDGAANPSFASETLAYTIDRTLPTAKVPSVTPRAGLPLSGTSIPVRLAWSAADAGGSGVARHVLEMSTNSGRTWTTVSASLLSPSADVTIPSWGYVRFRVAAVDRASNVGAWATSPVLSARMFQEGVTSIQYGGSWTSVLGTRYSGGSATFAKAASASATYTLTGRSIALVTTTAPSRGKVRVYVDGALVTTVDLWSSTAQYRVIAWQKTWSTSATRVVKLVVVGTAGRPRVDLDAFVTLR